jgi:hypothetical protein
MCVYYLMTESEDEVRELSEGRVPARVREMARACLHWELEDQLALAQALEAEPPKKPTKRTRRDGRTVGAAR